VQTCTSVAQQTESQSLTQKYLNYFCPGNGNVKWKQTRTEHFWHTIENFKKKKKCNQRIFYEVHTGASATSLDLW